jgi:hypothetical protein
MSINKINLTQYDTVVAVTQSAVNQALATWVEPWYLPVLVTFNVDESGNFEPADPGVANYTFMGTLTYPLDGSGNPVVVELNNAAGNQTVTYLAPFTQARLLYTGEDPWHVVQADGETWAFKFAVSLAMSSLALDDLPDGVQQQVQAVVHDLARDAFSIQQLSLAMNTAKFDTLEGAQSLNLTQQKLLRQAITAYVISQPQPAIVLGYAVQYTGGDAAPAFMPTSLDFVVTPWTTASGADGNPALDTLDFLAMTGKRDQPTQRPASFGWNWADDGTAAGTMAVKQDVFAGFIAQQLAPVLKTLCPVVQVYPDGNQSVYNQPIFLKAGTDQSFDLASPPQDGVIASYYYPSQALGSTDDPAARSAQAGYTSDTQIALSGSTITVSGTITFSMNVDGDGTTVFLPDTTYAWWAQLTLQTDPVSNGQLILEVDTGFSDAPTVYGRGTEGWETFLSGLPAGSKLLAYLESLGDLRTQVQTEIETNIVPALTSALSGINGCVFPAAMPFTFTNPQFSDALDLASNITFAAPQQPAPLSFPTSGTETVATLTSVSTLMKNQKAAAALPAHSLFAAAQTSDGQALFFSIGDDGVFHLSYPQADAPIGWATTALSDDFLSNANNAAVTARTFDVAQDPSTGLISVAVTVRADGETADRLYVLMELSDAPDADWLGSEWARPWVPLPWSDTDHLQPNLDVAYLRLAPRAQRVMAGVRDPDTKKVQNYEVSTQESVGTWDVLRTAANYTTMLDHAIGHGGSALEDGLYELYSVSGQTDPSLMLTPLDGTTGATTLTAPAGASALAPVPGMDGTDLYVAATGGLYRWPAGGQTSNAAGTQVVASTLFGGTSSLRAHATATEVVVWGLNSQNQVIHTRCPVENVRLPAAWSVPLAIEVGVAQMASFVNRSTSANELFTHAEQTFGSAQGQTIMRLVQDPVTTLWRRSNILLPPLAVTDLVEFHTYTTQVTATDGNGLPLGETSLQLSSTSPVGVWVNHVYMRLSETPVQVTTDIDSTLTIVQQTESVGAVAYYVQAAGGTRQSVNPMSGPLAIMGKITDGASLRAVQVTDSDGNTVPLLPADVSTGDSAAAAKSLAKLVGIAMNLPQDGSVQQPQPTSSAASTPARQIWGMTFGEGGARHWEGLAGVPGVRAAVGAALLLDADDNDVLAAIEAAAGNVFRWLKYATGEVTAFTVNVVQGVANFIVNVAEKAYTFVLNAIDTVVQAAEFVLRRLGLHFEDLVPWLGFVFDWPDIVRTHRVLANIVRQYVASAPGSVATCRTGVTQMFDKIEDRIAGWSDLTAAQKGSDYLTRPTALQASPQAGWGTYHLKGNLGQATGSTSVVPGNSAQLPTLLQTALTALHAEGTIFQNAFDTVQNQILAQLPGLTVAELAKRLAGVISEVMVQSVQNVLGAVLDVLEILMNGVVGLFDATIEIPVLSPLYSQVAGGSLTVLDLMALVVAIPVTVAYKAAYGTSPFPDNAFTTSLISATSLDDIRTAYAPKTSAPSAALLALTPANDTPAPAATLVKVLHMVSAFGCIPLVWLSMFKRDENTAPVSILHGAAFFFTTAPSMGASIITTPQPTWEETMSITVYSITTVQKMMDVFTYTKTMGDWGIASGWLDLVLGVAGLVPPIGVVAKAQNQGTILGLVGGVAWNGNRIMTPFAKETRVFAAKMSAIGVFGVTQFILGEAG